MGFPVIESRSPTSDNQTGGAATSGSTATTSHAVVLPATVSAGATLIVAGRVAVAGTVAVTGGGWTIVQDSSDGSDDVSFWMFMSAAADGTEGGTSITVTHGNGKMVAGAVSITGATDPAVTPPEASTVAVGTGSNPGPTTCTPTGGADDYLWIAIAGADGEQGAPTATPASYGNSHTNGSGTSGLAGTNVRSYYVDRTLNAASEDPGTWTTSIAVNLGWTSWCIAVHPGVPVPAILPLETADAVATGSLLVTAATQVVLVTAAAASTSTLAVTAPAIVVLETAAAQSAATLDVTAPSAGPTTTGTGLVQLGSLDEPDAGTQTLSIRARAASGSGILRTTLYDTDGVTARGTDDFTLTGSFQTFTLTPSGVTDWTALQVGFEARNESGDPLTAEVSWIELRVPQAAGPSAAVIPLAPATGVAAASLALTAQTTVALGTAAAVSTSSLALTAPAKLVLGAAAAVATTSLAVTAPAKLVLGASAATATATLALTAQTTIPLATSAAASTTSLALTAQTYIPLGTSAATSTTSLTVTAGLGVIPLQTSAATSTSTLAVQAPTRVPLGTSASTSTTSLSVSTPTQTFIAFNPAAATSTTTLAVTAQTRVVLQVSTGTATTSLAVYAPSAALLVLGAANANASTSLILSTFGNRWQISPAVRWNMDPEGRWQPTANSRWDLGAAGGRWDIDPQTKW